MQATRVQTMNIIVREELFKEFSKVFFLMSEDEYRSRIYTVQRKIQRVSFMRMKTKSRAKEQRELKYSKV